MKKYILFVVLGLVLLLSVARVSYARELSQQETNTVISLLQAFNLDNVKVEKIKGILVEHPPVNNTKVCMQGDKFSIVDGSPCPVNSVLPSNPINTPTPATPTTLVPRELAPEELQRIELQKHLKMIGGVLMYCSDLGVCYPYNASGSASA